MSADNVDDLHYAEDLLGEISTAMKNIGAPDPLEGYCRPTCGYLAIAEDGDVAGDNECTDETCGCPCSHPGSKLERVG